MKKKYRKKPIVVEAIPIAGTPIEDIKKFLGEFFLGIEEHGLIEYCNNYYRYNHFCDDTDYLIKDSEGYFYHCDEKNFKKTYEVTE